MLESRPVLVLYTKPGCHLCDDIKAELAALELEIGFELEERNIEANPAAFAAFRYLIPVLETSDGSLLYPPHDVDAIRRSLAAGQNPCLGATHDR